jgi:putative transposase
VLDFFRCYNYEHRHSGIGHLTPIQRYSGLENQILVKRSAVYEAAKQKHPERWSGDIRDWSLEKTAWLNPETNETEKQLKVAK